MNALIPFVGGGFGLLEPELPKTTAQHRAQGVPVQLRASSSEPLDTARKQRKYGDRRAENPSDRGGKLA